MPQERDNPFPFPTAEEVEAAPGTREQKSARFVIVRYIPGVPRRPYLMGDSDHAPIYRGVADLTAACWALLDQLAAAQKMVQYPAAAELSAILTDHGCPLAADVAQDKANRAEMVSD